MLVDAVHSDSRLKTVDTDEGQTRTVYTLETGGEIVPVFCEHLERWGVHVGSGALRTG